MNVQNAIGELVGVNVANAIKRPDAGNVKLESAIEQRVCLQKCVIKPRLPRRQRGNHWRDLLNLRPAYMTCSWRYPVVAAKRPLIDTCADDRVATCCGAIGDQAGQEPAKA